ncbi:MAG TPA: 3'-5' exonuclease, partial [Gemmatimonadaceae bacterium]|nr:3'-5' exonuclease [Gemmatimonadaceae bacterium]
WLATEIARRRGKERLRLAEFTVLYRTNAQSRALEDALRRHATPYRIIGSVRFYDRREIRDLMSYLKLIANPADDEAFRRAVGVPRRGLGEATIDRVAAVAQDAGTPMLEIASRPDRLTDVRPAARTALEAFATLIHGLRAQAADAAVDELLQEVIDAIHYAEHLRAEGPESAERLENVRELVTSAAEIVVEDHGEVGLRPLDHFLQHASLIADVDTLDPNADAVTLMTLHNAKGLEFPVVFITGLEDGLFPLARAFDDPRMLEEERRLFYVGVTRAERVLYLSYVDERRRNGELTAAKRSSFLDVIPSPLVEHRSTVKVRSSGRSAMRGASWGERRGWTSDVGDDAHWSRPARGALAVDALGDTLTNAGGTRFSRRPGLPVTIPTGGEEELSQDAARIALGARVRHRKFGSGTIAELMGAGREAKARIDFDDPDIGRKTVVLAQANLERGDD